MEEAFRLCKGRLLFSIFSIVELKTKTIQMCTFCAAFLLAINPLLDLLEAKKKPNKELKNALISGLNSQGFKSNKSQGRLIAARLSQASP